MKDKIIEIARMFVEFLQDILNKYLGEIELFA